MSAWKGLGAIAAGLVCGLVGALTWGLALTIVVALGRRERWVLALLFCLGCLRGASLAMASEPSFPREGPHLEFEVVGMPQIGHPCRVGVHDDARFEPMWLELSQGLCDYLPGQRILVSRGGPVLQRGLDGRFRLRRRRALLRRESDRGFVDSWLASLAGHRWRAWQRARTNPPDALSAAAALGLRSALAPEQRQALRLAGLGHLLAVSGLHVGLIAWLIYRLARAISGRSVAGLRGAWLLAALPVALYVFATGASPSALRAASMFAALSLGALSGRSAHPKHLLASVACVMVLWDPTVLREYGFWLSFTAMLAITSARGPLMMQWRLAWGLAGLNFALFGYVSWIGTLLNLLAVPVFSVAVLPMALLGWAWPGAAADWAREAARPGAQLVLDMAALGARVDPWGAQELAWLLGLGGGLWLLWSRTRARGFLAWRPPGWGLLTLACALVCFHASESRSGQQVRLELDWGRVDLQLGNEGWCEVGARWDGARSERELARRVLFEMSPAQRLSLHARHPGSVGGGLAELRVCGRGVGRLHSHSP